MNFNQIKTTAKGMGIDTRGMRKLDVVRAIQRAEHNITLSATVHSGQILAMKIPVCGDLIVSL